MKIFLLIVLFSPSLIAYAAEKPDPKPEMHALLKDIRALESYLILDKSYAEPKNEKDILARLTNLNAHVKVLKERKFKSDPALQLNVSMLSEHLSDTQKFFVDGNKDFSRFMLQSSLQMCISCHSRMNGGVELDFPIENTEAYESTHAYDRAQFYFATRQFSKALDSFKQAVDKYGQSKNQLFNLRRALNSIAIIYTRVKADPTEAAKYFATMSDNTAMPSFLRQDLAVWSKSFKLWSKSGVKNYKKYSDKELLAAAKDLLKKDGFQIITDVDNKYYVDRLRASAILHQILDLPNNTLAKGEALYLLGRIYNRIETNLFFRFDQMYLKACISEYTGTKLAEDCYTALEEIILTGFTGSGGTNIPADVELELIRLQQKAQQK